ncbi:MAG TPA: hypothetical protein VHW00_14415 [Thermoanaerobaculia bacterium]|nr:hypothetical protein [Thermoanaerobaculia bacterium]
MYALLAFDALLRIVLAMALLVLAVPALARRRPESLDRFEWFWWCLAACTIGLTLLGQLLTLFNIFSTFTLLVALAAVILVTRAHTTGRPAFALVRDVYRAVVVSSINILEGRVNVRRRAKRLLRNATRRLRMLPSRNLAGWLALIAIAAALRLIRPFTTANLGFSDTYAHLYLFRLLEQGRQVDPAWGPYPRGMHFLLMAIHELTNVDAILLMNFFGSIVGVLMTVAVADVTRRLAGSLRAGLIAGLLFATMTGGAAQYFFLGGSVATTNDAEGRAFVKLRAGEIPPTQGEYDVLATVFQRQTATLPQELAIVFLFPAAMFLMRWSASAKAGARDNPFARSGYFLCTAAIAAVHPGVAVPLVILSAITVLVTRGSLWKPALAGAAGIALGSTWMLGYLRYSRVQTNDVDAASTAMYYFPFLREGEVARIVTWVAITPVFLACVVLALLFLVRALLGRRELLWPALAVLAFSATHVASRFGWPEVVEVRRNSSWLAMAMAMLLGIALFELARLRLARVPIANIAIGVALLMWLARVPVADANDRLINYSGYSATAFTVLDLERRLEPFTWTLVTYGQEFPMVLGKGFHLAAADFLEQYDPEDPRLPIPTKYVYIVVEKLPHHFQINTWAARFSRSDLQQRLQTWCFLYQLSHRNIRIAHDDEHVRVYVIERSDEEVRQLAQGAR